MESSRDTSDLPKKLGCPYYQQVIPRRGLITGAAGGIGRAVVLRLAAAGYELVLVDRTADALAALAESARAAGAARVEAVPLDLADGDALAHAVARVGAVAALVCAAGVLRPGGLHDVTSAQWEHHFAVNTTAVLRTLQSAQLVDGAAVVVVGSNAARVPRTGMLAYAASKAATAALTRCAGLELAARGIRCNVVEPGSTDTAMQRDLWPDAEVGRRAAIEGDPARFRLGIPLGRIADPDDIAGVVTFLLSDDARHITLQQLYIDGGASL